MHKTAIPGQNLHKASIFLLGYRKKTLLLQRGEKSNFLILANSKTKDFSIGAL